MHLMIDVDEALVERWMCRNFRANQSGGVGANEMARARVCCDSIGENMKPGMFPFL